MITATHTTLGDLFIEYLEVRGARVRLGVDLAVELKRSMRHLGPSGSFYSHVCDGVVTYRGARVIGPNTQVPD